MPNKKSAKKKVRKKFSFKMMSYSQEAMNLFWATFGSHNLSAQSNKDIMSLRDAVDNLFPMIIDKAFNDGREYQKKLNKI